MSKVIGAARLPTCRTHSAPVHVGDGPEAGSSCISSIFNWQRAKRLCGISVENIDHIFYIRPISFPEAINRIPGLSVVSNQLTVSGTQGICFPVGESATISYGVCYIYFRVDFEGQLKP